MKTINLSEKGPININDYSQKLKDCKNDCILKFYYNYSNITLNNRRDHLYINFDKNNYVSYNNNVYVLDYGTFTSGSSHTLNDKQYDLELYLVHSKYTNKNDKLILNILVEQNNVVYEKNKFFKHFRNISYPKNNEEVLIYDYNKKLNVYDILPHSKKFYEYGNSDNKTNIINIVFKNTIYIHEEVINKIKQRLSILSDEINSNYTDNINYNNKTVIKNNYKDTNILSDNELRDTCVDIYKDKSKDYNSKYSPFSKYFNIFKTIIVINLCILTGLLILDIFGLNKFVKDLLKPIMDLLLKIFNFVFNYEFLSTHIILILVSILIFILIKYKPFILVKDGELDFPDIKMSETQLNNRHKSLSQDDTINNINEQKDREIGADDDDIEEDQDECGED